MSYPEKAPFFGKMTMMSSSFMCFKTISSRNGIAAFILGLKVQSNSCERLNNIISDSEIIMRPLCRHVHKVSHAQAYVYEELNVVRKSGRKCHAVAMATGARGEKRPGARQPRTRREARK